MIPTVNTDQVVSHAARVAGGRRLRWFFPGLSGVPLAMLVVGFAPSFFLRGRISMPSLLSRGAERTSLQLAFAILATAGSISPLPYRAWHRPDGVVRTGVAQTCLVAAGRTDLHRRLGIAGLGVAILIVPISALVVVRAVPRLLPILGPQAVSSVISGDFADRKSTRLNSSHL